MSKGVYKITEEFEQSLSEYTGAPYVVTIDNACNALFLCLYYEKNISKKLKSNTITIPERTYPGVPPEIIRNGFEIMWKPVKGKYLEGPYQLEPSNVWDSALRFTHKMYIPGTFMCISMTGGLKNFKAGAKMGAILCDSEEAAVWFKRARFSGRREMPYMEDNLDQLGWNFYLNPELAVRGLIMMTGFYQDGKPLNIPDKKLPYPKLSDFSIYNQPKQIFTREELLEVFHNENYGEGSLNRDEYKQKVMNKLGL